MKVNFPSAKESEEDPKDSYPIEMHLFPENIEKIEKKKKNVFLEGFFGISSPKKGNNPLRNQDNNIQPDDSESEEEEDSSPMSPFKRKGKGLSAFDKLEKFESLNLKQMMLAAQIKSVVDKINVLDKHEEVFKHEKTNKRLDNLKRELEKLQGRSNDLTAIKESLEQQPDANVTDRERRDSEDLKPINVREKFQQTKRKLLMNKIQLRIFDLFKKITHQKVEEFDEEFDSNSADKLSCDSYLFSSMLLEYLIFFITYALLMIISVIILTIYHCFVLIFQPLMVLFGCSSLDILKESYVKVKKNFIQVFSIIFQVLFILAFFLILFFPGVLVVATQILCIGNLGTVTYVGTSNSSGLLLLKELMVLFFFFLSMKEISSAIDAIAYHYKRTFQDDLDEEKKNTEGEVKARPFLFPIRILPQLLQIVMTFWFSYINIYIIGQVDDSANLVQNFAALAIVLEFDNYVMDFLRYMRVYTIYNKFLDAFLGDEDKKQNKINKIQKKIKIEEYKKSMLDYENILQTMIKDRRQSKYAPSNLRTDDYVDVAKNKIERLRRQKKLSDNLDNIDDNQDNKQELSEFWKIIHSFVDQNMIKNVISFLGKQKAIKVLLTNEEYPIDKDFRLSKSEKKAFHWFTFLAVCFGSLVVLMVFLMNNEMNGGDT